MGSCVLRDKTIRLSLLDHSLDLNVRKMCHVGCTFWSFIVENFIPMVFF